MPNPVEFVPEVTAAPAGDGTLAYDIHDDVPAEVIYREIAERRAQLENAETLRRARAL